MKVVLYTCTFLDYDQVFSPLRLSAGVDHVLIADRRPRFVRGWRWRPLPPEVDGLSQSLANRHCKFFAHRLFPDADISIYVDGNTLILDDLGPLVAEFAASGAEIGLFAHRERGDIYAEFETGRRSGRIPPDDAARGAAQLARYRAAGLPEDHPFTENGIIFRRHGGPRLDAAMTLWWEEITTYTRRDQISLPYVLHATGIAAKVWDWNYKYENPYFVRYPHRDGFLVNAGIFLRNGMLRGPVRRALYGTALYGLRFATGNFRPVEYWRPDPGGR
jgi:hypothetical protein